jgi:branched-chain amino acid transport system ATP-binding protein
MTRVFGVFASKQRATQLAGTLSGGSSRCWRWVVPDGAAQVLLMDEPSMGLAPIMVDKIFEVVGDIHSRRRFCWSSKTPVVRCNWPIVAT